MNIYENKPHIVCLTETWLNDSLSPTFINYKPFFKNRPGSERGGGLLTLIRDDISWVLKPLNELFHIQP